MPFNFSYTWDIYLFTYFFLHYSKKHTDTPNLFTIYPPFHPTFTKRPRPSPININNNHKNKSYNCSNGLSIIVPFSLPNCNIWSKMSYLSCRMPFLVPHVLFSYQEQGVLSRKTPGTGPRIIKHTKLTKSEFQIPIKWFILFICKFKQSEDAKQ